MSDPAPVAAPAAPAAAEATTDTAPVAAKAPESEATEEYEIDGEKVHWTKTQARTHIQKSGAADKRLQQAAEKNKAIEALAKLAEDDYEAFLKKLGKDPEKLHAAALERRAKQALMTPEQVERATLERERDELKAKVDAREAETKAKADAELDEHNTAALAEQLTAVADKHGLDRSPEALEGLAEVGLELLDLLGPGITAEQVAQEYLRRESEHLEAREKKLMPRLKGERLKAYMKSNVTALLKLPGAELLEILGPDGVKAIQDATLANVPGPGASKPRTAVVAPPPRNGSNGRFMTEGEFNKAFPFRR